MKNLSFSRITFADLARLVQLRQVTDDTIFTEWFGYGYQLNETEKQLLLTLIEENRPLMLSYSEDELKMKFLAPLLNAVHFHTEHFREWYQRPLKAKINNVILSGYVDFMVATGFKEPEKPYFFIQEFKKTKIEIDPEDQLLAEMLVAMTLDRTTIMHGAYIIGKIWNFVILTQRAPQSYEYYVSLAFDSSNPEALPQIYVNLQAVKALFCRSEPRRDA